MTIQRHSRESGNPLPEGWTTTKLEMLTTDISYGYTASSSVNEVGPKMLRITDIQDNSVEWPEVPYCEIEEDKIDKYLLKENDLVFARTGATVGKSFLIRSDPPKAVYASYLIRVRTASTELISLLSHFFNSHQYWQQITEFSAGIGQPNVNGTKLKGLTVTLPPLAEQKVIADKLDTLLAQVETTKARLVRIPQILKTFRQSVLAAAVSGKLTEVWRSKNRFEKTIASSNEEKFIYEDKYNFETPEIWWVTAIGNAAKFQQGLQIAKSARGLKSDEGVLPILRTVNYENGFKKDVQYAFVDDKSIIAEPEDIILSRTGTVGRVLTGYKGIMHNNSFRINYDKSILIKDFLAYFLSSPICQTYVKENSGRSTQPDLTHKAFSKCPIGIPSINEQTEIVKSVEELFAFADSIEQKANAALEKVDNLTQSILAKAFRGELTADWREQNPELISGENSADALLARIKAEREVLKPKKVTRKKKA
ncbi:MAG: restriction endonuclease subunit S [Alteromonas stellipolaris]|uniref:restriction endonuclease subunit S n=1 Tax=Alteromonas stellipolaris TaxID=233316 RepID=UPI003B8CAFE3